MDTDAVELREAKYELHRLCTDPVRDEMITDKAIQSMWNLMTFLKPAGAGATVTSILAGEVQGNFESNAIR